ncbi:activity-dependent neuroprotective protein 2a [Engraulis encrasicolus]|uniref:activity-dependent neuroprotective protein 2a n=1 Tax=Engraulis encrasicolus TaxID=184585 RepID=UPI002FCF0C24
MFQNPVGDLEKVRRCRKRVKDILSDIGLESCSELSEELKNFDAGDESFNDTEWDDLSDSYGSKRRKKWCYRTQKFCCNLCWYSTKSAYSFRTHVHRSHEEELDLASLTMCKSCSFIGHPSVTDKHFKMFHTTPKVNASQATSREPIRDLATIAASTPGAGPCTATNDRYFCRTCGYQDSLIYVMKKHILVNHNPTLLKRYVGHRSPDEKQKGDGKFDYYCKMCSMPAQTCEHLLFHILSSEKHKELDGQLKNLLGINMRFMNRHGKLRTKLVPKIVVKKPGPVPVVVRPPTSTATSSGTMLLASQSNSAALLCAPGTRQMYIPSQASAKNLLLSNPSMATLQNSSQGPARFNMFVPGLPQTRFPITVRVPGLPQSQPRQVLLPPGMRLNVPGKMGSQPLLMTSNLGVNQQSTSQSQMLTSQSIRLIPTGNNVNGVPTYTLASVPVVGKGPVVLTQNSVTGVQQLNTAAAVPQGVAAAKAQQKPAVPKPKGKHELVVFSPFLKMEDKTVRCLKCKIMLTEKGIFHHLLHGLKCVFCPQMFYSLQQVTDHMNTQHSLSVKANRELLKKDFEVDTDERGELVIGSFDLNTNVPREQLGDRELSLLVLTGGTQKIFLKMYPEAPKAVVTAAGKHIYTGCPLCQTKMSNREDYETHLKIIHHIMPTIHAILKTAAFKCIYCLGVYTERFTQRTVSIHLQRCRCAPKAVKDVERQRHPDPHNPVRNGAEGPGLGAKPPTGTVLNGGNYPYASVEVTLGTTHTPSKYAMAAGSKKGKVKGGGNTWRGGSAPRDPANRKDRITPVDLKSRQVRKKMLNKYFNEKPYISEAEIESLAAQLWLKRPDVVAAFEETQKMCLEAINSRKMGVLLGFNMMELKKVKHNIVIPSASSVKNRAEAAVGNTVEAAISSDEAAVNTAEEAAVDNSAEVTVNNAAEAAVDNSAEVKVNNTAEAGVDNSAEVTVNNTAEAAVEKSAEVTVDNTAEVGVNTEVLIKSEPVEVELP